MREAGGLQVRNLQLRYGSRRGDRHPILDVREFSVPAGSCVAVTGPSGSGKTSLLHVLSGIERATTGRVVWNGIEISALSEGARDRWRRRNVGFVFQDFQLLPGLSALANVLLPVTFDHAAAPASLRARARALLEHVGIAEPRQRIETLSRGEMQRVALARALLREPPILLADEPTASLDAETGRAVSELMLVLCRNVGTTLIAVTHDTGLVARLETVYRLDGGRLAAGRSPPISRLTGTA